MAEIGIKRAQIFLIIEEIMLESFFVLSLLMTKIHNNNRTRRRRQSRIIRYIMVDRIPKQIEHMQELIELSDVDCLNNLRMTRVAFSKLCYLLKHVGGLTDSRYVFVNEKVALFLSILAHHKKVRIVRFDFKRSGQMVTAHFHVVLNVVLRIHSLLIVKPESIADDCLIPSWKLFKECAVLNIIVDWPCNAWGVLGQGT
ncbi:hypothetical protein DH2020_018503 [Rehmannia glutinosa]|uniref:DUF8040 domain-containing protein n=1 Tax=Rehmannia glutinosa TaxID=99300 RepID=A0ABR0WJ39_REHGL